MKNKSDLTKGSIMIVDDSAENLHLMTDELKHEGYEIRPVLNGKQALDAAFNNPPDLILLDIRMPGMDGYDVLKELKAHTKTEAVPVIFLTALNEPKEEEKGLTMGVVDYVTKPVVLPILKSRVKTHMNLKLQRDKLEERNRELQVINDELNAFAYSASHDLKAPLALIDLYTQFIRERFEATHDADGVENVESVESACHKMQQLIDSLLKLSRIGQNEMHVKPVNLSQVAEFVFEEIAKGKKDVEVEFRCSPNIIDEADPQLMHIAMYNLMDNAYKYASKSEKPVLEFGIHKENDCKMYYVRDNGVGFDMEEAKDLFIPFKRLETSKHFEGTGIGLAIVKRIIERHHGRIWAEGHYNQGATFYFTLNKDEGKGGVLYDSMENGG